MIEASNSYLDLTHEGLRGKKEKARSSKERTHFFLIFFFVWCFYIYINLAADNIYRKVKIIEELQKSQLTCFNKLMKTNFKSNSFSFHRNYVYGQPG